jgi:hypothetical protein
MMFPFSRSMKFTKVPNSLANESSQQNTKDTLAKTSESAFYNEEKPAGIIQAIELLHERKRRGILTDSEFEIEKGRVLDR